MDLGEGDVVPGFRGDRRLSDHAASAIDLRGQPVPEDAPTGFLLHPSASLHDPGWGHPDHQGRLPALASALEKELPTLHREVEQVEGRFALREELGRVHTPGYLDELESVCARAAREGRPLLAGPETPVSGATWEALLGSAGTAIEAVEQVARGRLRNAFVATRPPGHHAGKEEAMGFCAINHVAVAARHVQQLDPSARVAIVDWDVHHGNGTQDIFYRDPSVFYLSLHQRPLFPGTGGAEETGEGEGAGCTLNVPLPAGTSREVYQRAFLDAVGRAEERFTSDFILISAGYDTLAADPLGGMLLEPEDFHGLTRAVMEWGKRACGGRVVALLEGGYAPKPTGAAVAATVRALAGR